MSGPVFKPDPYKGTPTSEKKLSQGEINLAIRAYIAKNYGWKLPWGVEHIRLRQDKNGKPVAIMDVYDATDPLKGVDAKCQNTRLPPEK